MNSRARSLKQNAVGEVADEISLIRPALSWASTDGSAVSQAT
jgi:hypothetical protein